MNDYVKDWVAHGLRCRVIDGPFKNYNGYVAVPKGHPAFGKDYDKINVAIHGGLTFGEQGEENSLRWPDSNAWWFGFDTAHSGDWIEYKDGQHPEPDGRRWTKDDVAQETENLAKQLANLHKDGKRG